MSKKQLMASLDVSMGGRVAEEMVYGADGVTTGAIGDIRRATALARDMVTKYGFSERVGFVYHDDERMGESGGRKFTGSETLLTTIDSEIRRITDESYARVRALLGTWNEAHAKLVKALLEKETLSGAECIAIVNAC